MYDGVTRGQGGWKGGLRKDRLTGINLQLNRSTKCWYNVVQKGNCK